MYQVIETGSKGNCEIAMGSVMIDIGVSFTKIKKYINDIQIVFLSHTHKDHLKIRTLKLLQKNRPTVRVACGEWMVEHLTGVKNIDVLELNKWYNYGPFRVSIGKLYHDVPNCFFRFDFNGYRIFRATDTAHLQGITAKGYDIYAIEANYDEEKALQAIEMAKQTGEYCHAKGSINSHLSTRQTWDFLQANKKEDSEVIELHMSSKFY